MSAVIQISDEIVSTNPATGEEVGRVKSASAAEVREAVARGREAFLQWRQTSFGERKRLVMKAREVILSEMEEIAHLISYESGKPLAEAFSMEIAPVLD